MSGAFPVTAHVRMTLRFDTSELAALIPCGGSLARRKGYKMPDSKYLRHLLELWPKIGAQIFQATVAEHSHDGLTCAWPGEKLGCSRQICARGKSSEHSLRTRDLASGRVHITSQNHGYAVDGEGLPDGVEVSHVHLNDGTCEGLAGTRDPFLTIQYHSEAAPGPLDNMYIFEQFVKLLDDAKSDAL